MRRLLLVILCLSGCARVEELRERMRGPTPHTDYVEALRAAGLHESALARDWIAEASRAVSAPLPATVPLEETGYIDPVRPQSISLRVSLERGQSVSIAATLSPSTDGQLFVDVYRMPSDSGAPAVHVAAADSGTSELQFEPSRSGDYVIRMQPELLRGGRYTLSVRTEPTLAFPVKGVGEGGIGSRFGVPRDAGARSHHGVDIFAPRGTPVIAATDGSVNRVQETPRGGKVVWLRDGRRGQSLYYAHLDSQHVASGARVKRGDTLGFVGNTGNARTTPPHLHFGVYSRGPVDPYYFLHRLPTAVARLAVDTTLYGDTVRTKGNAVVMRVIGGSGGLLRVMLPDNSITWTNADDVERFDAGLSSISVEEGCVIRDAPRDNAAAVHVMGSATRLDLLGRFDGFELVRDGAVTGWVRCLRIEY